MKNIIIVIIVSVLLSCGMLLEDVGTIIKSETIDKTSYRIGGDMGQISLEQLESLIIEIKEDSKELNPKEVLIVPTGTFIKITVYK
jgi:hypothetical protein